MWEKVKDKEREHSSSPAWVNSPNPTGELSSTSWKSRDLRGWLCLVPVWCRDWGSVPSLGVKPPLALIVGTGVNQWQRKRGPVMAGTCHCHLPVLLWNETATSTKAAGVYVMLWAVNPGSVWLFQNALASWMPLMRPPACVQNAVFHVLLLSLNIFE